MGLAWIGLALLLAGCAAGGAQVPTGPKADCERSGGVWLLPGYCDYSRDGGGDSGGGAGGEGG